MCVHTHTYIYIRSSSTHGTTKDMDICNVYVYCWVSSTALFETFVSFFHMTIYIWIQIVTVYGVSAKYTTRYIVLRIAVYSGIVFHGPAIIRLRDCVYLIAVYEVDGLLE